MTIAVAWTFTFARLQGPNSSISNRVNIKFIEAVVSELASSQGSPENIHVHGVLNPKGCMRSSVRGWLSSILKLLYLLAHQIDHECVASDHILNCGY